jgi:CRISPR-associated protein Cas5d
LFKIIVEGDYACFTRPELKVERVSYDVPTPCALEGMLKSIHWKPAIRYVIDQIIVFNRIRFANIKRNELKDKLNLSAVKGQMKSPDKDISIYADSERSQRASMILKDVRYGVAFRIEQTGLRSEKADETIRKHEAILRRRLEKGQYFRTPVLGCREFPVKKIDLVDGFDLLEVDDELRAAGDIDLGYMLYALRFEDGGRPVNDDWTQPKYSDRATALYYRPHIVSGCIDVQRYAEGMVC